VTAADLEANAAIIAALSAAFPDDAILTEETPDDPARLSKPRVWIIDPLDGTRDFVARTGDFCVHIGLAVASEAVLGVVYQPSATPSTTPSSGAARSRSAAARRTSCAPRP
jgi:3'-phosphoadenosine 5'-phosphosulfate (PAPS) 3'-phosphatase